MIKRYDKLVRDRVPDLIAADGLACEVETLAPDRFYAELKRKLVEEALEAQNAATRDETLGELADLAEVVNALIEQLGATPAEVDRLRRERRVARGGFERRLFLLTVTTKPSL